MRDLRRLQLLGPPQLRPPLPGACFPACVAVSVAPPRPSPPCCCAQEPRHAYGMRRLGIPNTKHFHDVTSIKDAITLYQKLRTEIEAEAWKPEAEEEFEDTEGNVLSRKVRRLLLPAVRSANVNWRRRCCSCRRTRIWRGRVCCKHLAVCDGVACGWAHCCGQARACCACVRVCCSAHKHKSFVLPLIILSLMPAVVWARCVGWAPCLRGPTRQTHAPPSLTASRARPHRTAPPALVDQCTAATRGRQ